MLAPERLLLLDAIMCVFDNVGMRMDKGKLRQWVSENIENDTDITFEEFLGKPVRSDNPQQFDINQGLKSAIAIADIITKLSRLK